MDNINDIISNLSSEDIDMLKGVASSILGGEAEKNDSSPPAPVNNTNSKNSNNSKDASSLIPASLGFDNIDFDMIMKAKTIFEKMNNTSNKNVDLIMALKPHLDPRTQNKADQALRILKLFEVLPLLRELF